MIDEQHICRIENQGHFLFTLTFQYPYEFDEVGFYLNCKWDYGLECFGKKSSWCTLNYVSG